MVGRRTDETVRLGSDTTEAERGLRGFVQSGKALLLGLFAAVGAAAVALGAQLVSTFREQERAELRLRRALVAQGQYTKELEQQYHDLATAIQATTAQGDEATQSMIAQFISVGEVGEQSMEGAIRAAVGYAELTNKNATRVTRSWSTAFADIANDAKNSIGELEQLFTASEAEMLRALKETEGGAVAQARAIEILNQRYGAHARAIEGSTDVYAQVSNSWGDVQEELGRMLHTITGPLAGHLRDLFTWLADRLQDLFVFLNTITARWDVFTSTVAVGAARIIAWFDSSAEAEQNLAEALAARAAALDELAAAQERVRQGLTPGATTGAALPSGLGGAAARAAAIRAQQEREERERREAEERRREEERRAREEERLEAQRVEGEHRIQLLEATLSGMEDAEVRHMERQLEIQREHAEAMKLLEDERTEALGEVLLRELELRRQFADQELAEARAAAQAAVDDEAGTSNDILQIRQQFFQGMEGLTRSGNSALGKLGRAAAKLRLLTDLATKPYEAYAKTSAAFPWPLGPALGAAHAAAVAAQIAIGLRSVGGGGGGGSSISDRTPTVQVGRGAQVPDRREPQRQVIHMTVELEGNQLAQFVEERLVQAEDG